MRARAILAGLLLALVLGAVGYTRLPRAAAIPNLTSCKDWTNQTATRVAEARQLLYPPERRQQSTGSLQGDARALAQLAQQQAGSGPPSGGANLNGDLVEALSAGAAALGGGGGASPDAQIAFAKAIVYNADLRLSVLRQSC